MDASIRKVHMVAKRGSDEALALGREIGAWLDQRGVAWDMAEHKAAGTEPHGREERDLPDMIVVLGGDGTFISEARRALQAGIPMLGLNMGNVGFLAEISDVNWREALGEILERGLRVKTRTALRYSVVRADAVIRHGLAVNDLVVSRGALARLVRLGLSVDGERVVGLRADGMIVSTPSGTTAYGVSAGGPLVHPDMACLCVTPICSFLSGFKSMVLPAGVHLDLVVEGRWGDVYLTVDGQANTPLKTGDAVLVSRAENGLKIVDTGRFNYFDKLKNRGFMVEG